MKKLFFIAILLSLFACKKEPIQYTFEGTVTSTVTGSGLSGAEVTISQKTFNNAVSNNYFEVVSTTQTDASGFYSVTFDREKVTEFRIEITKTGYFDQTLIIGSGEVTSNENNLFNTSIDGKSWAKFTIQNVVPNDQTDNLILGFFYYRTGCGGCIEQDYNYFDGIVDTTVKFTNTAGKYLKFSVNDGASFNIDSLLMPFNDTVSYSIVY